MVGFLWEEFLKARWALLFDGGVPSGEEEPSLSLEFAGEGGMAFASWREAASAFLALEVADAF